MYGYWASELRNSAWSRIPRWPPVKVENIAKALKLISTSEALGKYFATVWYGDSFGPMNLEIKKKKKKNVKLCCCIEAYLLTLQVRFG